MDTTNCLVIQGSETRNLGDSVKIMPQLLYFVFWRHFAEYASQLRNVFQSGFVTGVSNALWKLLQKEANFGRSLFGRIPTIAVAQSRQLSDSKK
jgi:hypothetical protein